MKEITVFFVVKMIMRQKTAKKKSVSEKREKLKEKVRCFICFGTRHMAKDCRTKNINCQKCCRRHFKSMCTKAERNYETIISVSPSESKRDAVLLQTATVWIETPAKRQLTRCLFDGGSQRSFVRKDIFQALNLPKIGEETLKLHTFGSECPKQDKCNVVKIKLSNIRNGQSAFL